MLSRQSGQGSKAAIRKENKSELGGEARPRTPPLCHLSRHCTPNESVGAAHYVDEAPRGR